MNNELEDLLRLQHLQQKYGLQPTGQIGTMEQLRVIPQYQDQRYQTPMDYSNQRINSPMQQHRPQYMPQNDLNYANNNNNNNGQQTVVEKAPERKVINNKKEKIRKKKN